MVDNCTISAPSGAVFRLAAEVGGNTLVKHNPFIVKVKDSYISAGGAAGTSVVCVPWNTFAAVDMSVENSTIEAVGGNATASNPETSYVFCFNPVKNGVADTSTPCNFTIDGTSKLIANFTGTVTPTGGIFNNIGGTATINLAEGAELYVNNGAEKTQSAFILNTRGNLTVNDNGAIWKIGANAAKNGVTLPTFTEDGENHVWYIDETPVVNPYVNASAAGDVVLTHAKLADPALDPNNICYYEVDGEKFYGTDMKATIAEAPDGAVIEVIRDFSVSGYIQWFGKNVIIDGNDYTITGTHSSYVFDINKAKSGDNPSQYSFTLKDANVVGAAGLWFNTDYITIENCTFTTNKYMAMSYDNNGGTGAIINIIDTEWNFTTDGLKTDAQPFMLVGTGKAVDVTFNIENSKIIGASGNGTSPNPKTPNNAFFNLNTAGTATFNVDGTSVIKSVGATTGGIFTANSILGKLVLNLEDGATLALDNCMANSSFIATLGAYTTEKIVINDNGANWVIADAAAEKGVNLPVVGADGETVIGYAKDGKIHKVNTTVAGTYKSSDFATVIAYTAEDFDIIDGASIRTQDGSGIRFSTTVSEKLQNALGENASFGTLIGCVKLLDEGAAPTLGDVTEEETSVVNIAQNKWGDDGETYHAALIDIPDEAAAFTTELAGRAYMIVTYVDGTTATYYTAFDAQNVRSMYTVATNLADAGLGNAVTTFIIDTVNAAS